MLASEPWLKTESEPQQAYQAFCDYRDMGAERSLQKLLDFYSDPAISQRYASDIPTKSLPSLKRWSKVFDWQERIKAWETAQSRIVTERAMQAIAQEHDRRLERFREFSQDNGDTMLKMAKDLMSVGSAMLGLIATELTQLRQDQQNGERIPIDKMANSAAKVVSTAAQLAQIGADISATCLGLDAQNLNGKSLKPW